VALTKVIRLFDALTAPSGSWIADEDPDYYIYRLPFTTHQIVEPSPQVEKRDPITFNFELLTVDTARVDEATNDVIIKVLKNPDGRFEGKIKLI
jgi:hypothetical protein